MSNFLWLLSFSLLFVGSHALDCVQIPDSKISPGKQVTIPDGAQDKVIIPPNYNCTYYVKVPPTVYAHVQVENGLKSVNDMILVRDEQHTRTQVSSRSNSVLDFYVFPNTTTTFQVVTRSVNMQSSFRLLVRYVQMQEPGVTQLGNSNWVYFRLNSLYAATSKPQTVKCNERMQLTIAYSNWDYDVFDNFFVVEGDFQRPDFIYRMSAYARNHGNIVTMNKTVTVVGLDNRVSESAVIFTPVSERAKFNQFNGVGAYFEAQKFNISTGGSQVPSVTNVISMFNEVTILDVKSVCGPGGSLKAVSTPPSDSSEVYFDFETNVYPRNISYYSFSVVARNCDATIHYVAPN